MVIRLVIGVAVAGGLLYAVFDAAGGVPAALDQLRRTRTVWLVPAVAAETVSYLLFGWQLRRLGGGGPRLRWWVWTQVALVVYGLGRLTPAAPAEGVVFSALQLQRRGMIRRRAGLVLLLGLWTQFWALILVFAADRIAAVETGDLHRAGVIVAGSVLMVGLTLVAATAIRRRSTARRVAGLFRFLPRRWHRSPAELRAVADAWHADISELIGPARTSAAVLAIAMGGWVSDALCLWLALIATHAHAGFDLVILADALASLAAWIPLLPGGIGVVEATVPAVLHHFGVPLLAALAGTLVWRALSLLLPALTGLAAAVALRLTQPVAVGAGPAAPAAAPATGTVPPQARDNGQGEER